MTVYGKDFAAIYNESWAFYADKLWPALSKAVERHCPQGRTWLDLCCGCGSMLRYICQGGYQATGLDLSPHQLEFAAQNAPAARLIRGDVRSFRCGTGPRQGQVGDRHVPRGRRSAA